MNDYIAAEKEFDFLKIFYEILFRPNFAAKKIRILKEYYPLKLLFYSLFILILSSLALAVFKENFAICVQNLIIWFTTILCLWLFVFSFRKKEDNESNIFPLLFFYGALAQSPTIFFSSYIFIDNVFLKVFCFIFLFVWQSYMWIWALHNSLQVSYRKAFLIWLLPGVIFVIWLISLIFVGLFQLFL